MIRFMLAYKLAFLVLIYTAICYNYYSIKNCNIQTVERKMKRMKYTFDKRCSDCKFFKDGKCTHPHSMYCHHCEFWAPKWFYDMRKKDGGAE